MECLAYQVDLGYQAVMAVTVQKVTKEAREKLGLKDLLE